MRLYCFDRILRKPIIWTVLCVIFVLALSQKPHWIQSATRNLAWLELTAGIIDTLQGPCHPCETATTLFSKLSNNQHHNNGDILQGLGLAQFFQGNMSDASLLWPQVPNVSRARAVVNWLVAHEQYTLAVQLLSNINDSLRGRNLRVLLDLGAACQKFEIRPHTPEDLCQDYWHRSTTGFIIDGDFNSQTMQYWQRHFTTGSTYSVDNATGISPPALKISATLDIYHGGAFQELILPKGTKVKFSAYLKTEATHNYRVLPLYVRYQINGETRVSAGQRIDRSMDWHYEERLFTAPGADNDLYRFYPAFIGGIGTLWVDQVSLKVIPPKK